MRQRRREAGVSQERLAEALDVTFQQIQKYERGANRVSASRLFQIAQALDTDIAYFFDGLEGSDSPSGPDANAFLALDDPAETADIQDLAGGFARIRRSQQRKILELLRALAAEEAEARALRRRPPAR